MKKINKLTDTNANVKNSAVTSINTILIMNQNRVINTFTGSDYADGVPVFQANNVITRSISSLSRITTFIPLAGTSAISPVTGNLIFSNTNTVTGLAPASRLTDAINFSQLKTFFSKYISLSGTAENSPVTGSLILDNTKITGIIPASSDDEAVNLQQLKDTVSTADLVPLSGGFMSGPVNMQSHTITNVGTAISSSDLISVSDANSIIETLFGSYLPLSGTTGSDFVTGNIFLDNKLITQIPIATQASQIISSANVKSVVNSLVALNTPNLSGSVNLSGYSVTNVSPATTASEGVNLQQVKTTMQSLLRITGGIMNTDLDMNNNTISGLKDATENTELINLDTLKKYTESQAFDYIPLSGTVTDIPVSGNLVFDSSHLITGISDPVLPADAVNLQTLQSSLNLKMPLTGGNLSGNVDMNFHSITSLSLSAKPNDNDAASLGYFSSLLQSEKYVPLSGTLLEQPVTGPLFFNNSATCSQIADPVNNSDAVNLQTLTKQASLYLSLSGGSLTGTLNMNNHNILNISNTGNPSSLVNLANLTTAVSKLVPLNSSSPILMTGALNMNSHTITDVPSAISSGDLVRLFQTKKILSLIHFIPFSGNNASSVVTGNLTLQNTRVDNISSPNNNEDAVTFLSLKDTFEKHLLLTGGVMTGSLNAGNNVISGLAEASSGTDAINLQNLNTSLSGLLPLKGGNLSGTLTMSSRKITGVPQPINSSDAVPLSFVTQNVDNPSAFIPLSGTATGSSVTGNIVMKNTTVTNISSPSQPSDAVRFDTLKNKISTYLPLSGSTMSGNIDMENHNIANLSSSSEIFTSLANKSYCDNSTASIGNNLIPLSGTVTGSSVTGNIVMSATIITNISSPSQPSDAVRFDTLKDKLTLYLPLSGNTMTGILNMNTHSIVSLPDPVNATDIVTLKYFRNFISNTDTHYVNLTGTVSPLTGNISFSSQGGISGLPLPKNATDIVSLHSLNQTFFSYLPLISGTLTGSLNMNDNFVTVRSFSVNPGDGVNFETMSNYITKIGNDAIPLSGTTSTNPVTGNLIFNGTTITDFKDPLDQGDIVSLKNVSDKLSSYLLLSGGNLSGSLNMNSYEITDVVTGILPTDAINYGQVTNAYTKYVQLNTVNNITGNILLNNTLVKNIPDPKNPGDAVNLNTLNVLSGKYMPLSGGILSGSVNMNNYQILNLGDGTASTDAANYGQLNIISEIPYYIQTASETITLTKNSNLNFSLIKGTTFSSSNYNSYFNVSTTRIYILQQGVYLFNLTLLCNSVIGKNTTITLGSFITSSSIGTSVNFGQVACIYPDSLFISVLLPFNTGTVTQNNTYLEIQNSTNKDIASVTINWDISLIKSILI